jgi:hypothetical protein
LRVSAASGVVLRPLLCGHQQKLKLHQAGTMEPSLVLQPYLVPHPATAPEVVTQFVERSAETARRPDVSESRMG